MFLGISAFFHDSAAALVGRDGEILAAYQEERFTRIRHEKRFPVNSILQCLENFDLSLRDLEAVVFYEKPWLKAERILCSLETKNNFEMFAKRYGVWCRKGDHIVDQISENLKQIDNKIDLNKKLYFCQHHISHAASAFYPSPFDDALVFTVDGVGEQTTTQVVFAKDQQLQVLNEIEFPNSLGLLYSAFTYFLGFKVNSGEYKMMGLAPYGKPTYRDLIFDNILSLKADGSFEISGEYFGNFSEEQIISKKFEQLFGIKRRSEDVEIKTIHLDIAASIQYVLERSIINLVYPFYQEGLSRNICLAGGVMLNCVANTKLQEHLKDASIWIQPAAGDAGGALGAALYYAYSSPYSQKSKKNSEMKGAYLGSEFNDSEIIVAIEKHNLEYHEMDTSEIYGVVAKAIQNGSVVGWFQGRSEFGPRALGNRSILADPREPDMQSRLNLKVKGRESFRPFAPAVLVEEATKWFEPVEYGEYMLKTVAVSKNKRCVQNQRSHRTLMEWLGEVRSKIPAVTHVDFSARVQIVDGKWNEKFYKLLKQFFLETGCPVLINTSFNVRGEPIVNTPDDAIACFMNTDIDMLCIGNCLLIKDEQDPLLFENFRHHSFNFGSD